MPVSLDRIQQCENCAPGVTNDSQRLEMFLADDMRHVLNVLLPRHVTRTGFARPASSTLIVKHESMTVSKAKELGKEVVVVSSRSAVQHQECRRFRSSVFAPIERYGCACCVAFC